MAEFKNHDKEQKELAIYSLIGSALGLVVLVSFAQAISGKSVSALAVIAFLVGPFAGGYLAARMHSNPNDWSRNQQGTVYATPIAGAILGAMILILFR